MQDDLLGMPGSNTPAAGSGPAGNLEADAAPDLSGLIRIEAPSYREALRRIGERFGKDVSIVHSRVIRRRGMLGALGATGVEVYVTGRADYEAWKTESWRRPVPPSREPESQPRETPASETHRIQPPATFGGDRSGPPPEPDLARLLRNYRGQMSDVLRQAHSQRRDVMEPRTDAELREGGYWVPHRGVPKCPDPHRAVPPLDNRRAGARSAEHPIIIEARRVLEAGDFSRTMERDIIARLTQRRLPGTSGQPDEVRSLTRIQLGELVRSKIPPCVPIKVDGSPGTPRVVSVVGPTGVGKTTTIAKLASPFHFNDRLRVGLVTLDTYRIGAVDQLRKFADIMGLPLEVVPPGATVRDAIHRLGDCDVVFLDTAGRSQNDARRLAETRDMLRGIGSLEVHLCLSMAASRNANLEVIRKFRVVPYNRILITKLDESSGHGALLDVFAAARTAVSYITCGQEVPDDIRAASVDRLESLILGDR